MAEGTGGLRRGQTWFSVFRCYAGWLHSDFVYSGSRGCRENHGYSSPNAIYRIVTRGDGKQKLFHDDGHYQRFTEGLEAEVLRSGWQVIAYCWMPNHIHALIKTPEPNLSNGMQHWLSGFANWYAKRNRRTGPLYQGRFKAFQVEDSSYFCTLSRYIHVNPCVGQKPLAEKPEAWLHSSYGNYIDRRRTQDWLWKIGSLAPKPFCKKSFCWPSQLGVESHFPNAIQD